MGQQVVLDFDNSTPVEVGGYYFKADELGNLEYAALASGPWVSTDMYPQQTVIESNAAYYVSYNEKNDKRYLMKHDLEKDREDRITKLTGPAYSVGALYDNLVFINYQNYDNFTVYVRVYDLNTHEMRKGRIKNANIQATFGEYVSFVDELHSDVSPYNLYLGRLTSKGTIADRAFVAEYAYSGNFVGSKLWFCSYKNPEMSGTVHVKTVDTENGLDAKAEKVRAHKAKNTAMQMAMNFQETRYGLLTVTSSEARYYLVDAKTGEKTRFYPTN